VDRKRLDPAGLALDRSKSEDEFQWVLSAIPLVVRRRGEIGRWIPHLWRQRGAIRLRPTLETIELVRMTQAEYDAWLPGEVAGYAQEHVRTGRWAAADALRLSREEHEKLLPQGPATPDHHLWSIVRSGDREPVGMLWMGVVHKPSRRAFIYNIEIYPQFRRHGYAMQAMLRLEEEARRLGLESIGLHVFGHNTAARPLYEKLGYVPTNINMTKRLS